MQELEQQGSDWLDQGFARSTRRLFRLGLLRFLNFLETTEGGSWDVERLKQERLKDVQDRKYQFENRTVTFFEWLKTPPAKALDIPFKRLRAKTGKIRVHVYHIPAGRTPSDSQRKVFINAVRSFFAFHRLDLRFTRQQKRLLGRRAREIFQDYLPDLGDLAKMTDVGSPLERYILLAGKDLGLRAVDFGGLIQGMFSAALDKTPPVFLGKIYTQKEGVYAFPYLTEDGQQAARVWLKILESRGMRDDNAPMLTIKPKEFSENLKRMAGKAGIDLHGQRIRFHCLRKFLIDRISLHMAESKWKQIVGKQIDESAYVSPLKLGEAFREVLNLIQVSTIKKTLQLGDDEIKELLDIARLFREKKLVQVAP